MFGTHSARPHVLAALTVPRCVASGMNASCPHVSPTRSRRQIYETAAAAIAVGWDTSSSQAGAQAEAAAAVLVLGAVARRPVISARGTTHY